MPVSNQNAPFKRSPEFSRDSFLRPPDWRWQEAKQLVRAQLTGTSFTSQSDPIILYAARIQKACRNTAARKFIQLKMPDAWQIFTLGTFDNSSQLRAQVQACFIYGLTPQKTAQKLKWITPIQAHLYKDLFCDLQGVQAISGWFEQMLLQPARTAKSMNLFRARALAHYHSLEAALHSLRFGNCGKSAKEAMDAMWRNFRNTQVFDYIAKQLNVPIQIYTQMMEQAVKNREDQAFMLQAKQGGSQSEAVVAAAQVLNTSIRGFSQAQLQLTTQAEKAGIDFSAQYMQYIIQKAKA